MLQLEAGGFNSFFLFFAVATLILTSMVIGFTFGRNNQPKIIDPALKADVVFKGLKFPTSMAFLGPNDIIVLEKDNGTVQRIVNGSLSPIILLDPKCCYQK